MSRGQRSFASRFVLLAGAIVVAALVAVVLGYYPTERLGGPPAIRAMWFGCGAAVLAGLIGAIPVCLPLADPSKMISRAFGAMALRLAVVCVVTASIALSGKVAVRPLLLWVAVAYMFTLAGDTWLLVRMTKTGHDSDPMKR